MAAKFFIYPFAVSGDLQAVPDNTDATNGTVSYQQGYGPDYSLDPTVNTNALNIERKKLNQVLFDITTAVRQYQTNSVPDFITSAQNAGVAYSYGKGAQVTYDKGDGNGLLIYTSLVASNNATPTDNTKWGLTNPLVDGTKGDIIVSSGGTAMNISSSVLTAAGRAFIAATSLAAQQAILGLGSMAYQNANSVAINGGTVDGVVIGGLTRAAGHFTTVDGTGAFSTFNTAAGSGATMFSGVNQSSAAGTAAVLALQPSATGGKAVIINAINDGSDNIEMLFYTSSAANTQYYRGGFKATGGFLVGQTNNRPTGTCNDGDVNIAGAFRVNGVPITAASTPSSLAALSAGNLVFSTSAFNIGLYSGYDITCYDITTSTAAYLIIQVATSSGWITTGYLQNGTDMNAGVGFGTGPTSSFIGNYTSYTDTTHRGVFSIRQDAAADKMWWQGEFRNNAGNLGFLSGGFVNPGAALTQIRIGCSAGTITGGKAVIRPTLQ